MDIQSWFENNGNYSDGLELFAQLPNCNKIQLRNFARENTSNFIKLKYELKKALMAGIGESIQEKILEPAVPQKPFENKPEPLLQLIIKQSADQSFEKETMAIYPMELHETYRKRVSNFYKACELKFQLNSLPEGDENTALKIILQLEDLWTRIDCAWMILDHWKDHKRIMPVNESEDFTKLTPIQLLMKRNQLESRISKRKVTIKSMTAEVEASPENRTISNLLNRKLEQLHQLNIDLETIRNLLKNE